MPVIGSLNIASPETWEAYVAGFKQGLAQAGFVEGRNVAIEYRWARSQYDRPSALAPDLADCRVAVIAANGGSRSALAARSATSSIPIVFTFGDGDPVQHGLVESQNRPGGNVTGIGMIAGALEPKRIEMLHEIVPK
jgi:putative ABC transport system substrate-binding protein